ncbi:conserved hypothetical protein [Ricinus communis]|uniref:Uncharacterized protein n=1 Tax=Ricinus communis TaxID=3988 RepID=B9SBW0_RICCO|nr:conserved hypothetical protein [Ricinus communis]
MGNCWSCTACKLNSGPTAAPAPPSAAAAAAAETIPEPDPVASSIGDVVDVTQRAYQLVNGNSNSLQRRFLSLWISLSCAKVPDF